MLSQKERAQMDLIEKSANRRLRKRQAEMLGFWVALRKALDLDKAAGLPITPQIAEAANKVRWHLSRVRNSGLPDVGSVNIRRLEAVRNLKTSPEQVKIFEQCETAVQTLFKQLSPDSETAKVANALLDVLAVRKKSVLL
jgi:hypothetical protein